MPSFSPRHCVQDKENEDPSAGQLCFVQVHCSGGVPLAMDFDEPELPDSIADAAIANEAIADEAAVEVWASAAHICLLTMRLCAGSCR